MKSLVEAASSIFKAIEKGWNRAGCPQEFTIKILEKEETNFLGMTRKPAKVALFFVEGQESKPTTQYKQKKRFNNQQQKRFTAKEDERGNRRINQRHNQEKLPHDERQHRFSEKQRIEERSRQDQPRKDLRGEKRFDSQRTKQYQEKQQRTPERSEIHQPKEHEQKKPIKNVDEKKSSKTTMLFRSTHRRPVAGDNVTFHKTSTGEKKYVNQQTISSNKESDSGDNDSRDKKE
ncbi:Jag N-terminal domain-containing protein [Candidatus Dependentiae bacterium]|nr:Jag N-terminal domain-containing protein [Candidatus Dependentiae bacterium]